jgi:CheY-like chemotaxis protein
MAHTILLADDSITIRKVVELSFHGTDIRVESVASGQEALDCLPEMKPDLVLADVVMPGPAGYDLCRRIKESENPVPVLLLRGAFEPFDEDQAEACGSDGHLVKPFETSVLVGTVIRLLHREPHGVQEPEETVAVVEEPPDPEILEAEALLDDLADEAAFSDGPAKELDVVDLEPDYRAPELDATEQALRKALAGVSQEIIREIVWDVVPELAKTLIRERIRELEREESDS